MDTNCVSICFSKQLVNNIFTHILIENELTQEKQIPLHELLVAEDCTVSTFLLVVLPKRSSGTVMNNKYYILT